MLDVAEAWLKSGKYAEIAGLKLRPIENPILKGTPLAPVRGQAQAFYMTDDNNLDWILKKFTPAKIPDGAYIKAIQSLVPGRPGFQSGYRRRVLSRSDVSQSGFFSSDLAAWVENTVLMARIKCDDWASLADKLRKGSVTLADGERMLLCKSLSENVGLLESADISHRDLSVTNVFVDVRNSLVHLIDWDSLYHPSLPMPKNTTSGTEGYVAPFVRAGGTPDPRITWGPRADRFSMAILNAEFLCMGAGTPLRNDGGMFEQSELYNRGGQETAGIINHLQKNFPGAAALLEKALQAKTFDDCPSPAEWLALGAPVSMPSVSPATVATSGTTSLPHTISLPHTTAQVTPGSFIPLDESAFVELDEGALVQLV